MTEVPSGPEVGFRLVIAGGRPKFVREKFAGEATPETDAVTVYEPAVLFAVKDVEVATPAAFVSAVFTPPANVPLAPMPGAVKVTVTPLTRLLRESFTVAWSGAANAELTATLCGVPEAAVILAAGPAKLVKEKFAVDATPEAPAATIYEPAMLFAVNTLAVAIPDALVVIVFTPPANEPLAPLVGTMKVTLTPLTGLLNESLTVT